MAKDVSLLADQLLALKRQIETDKEKKARLEGRLTSLMERLQKEFGCKTIQEAEKKLTKLGVQIEELQVQVKEKIDGIRKQYAAGA